MKKRITVKDIARMAGVSHSTVSRALNDSPRVLESTRDKIKELARENNFQFNSIARGLSRRRTGVIGIIYPTSMDDFNCSLYTSQLFLDLRKNLEVYKLDGILVEAYNPKTGESNIERLIYQNKVDGFLIIHEELEFRDYELIRKWNLPVVQVHLASKTYSMESLDCFFTDNVYGGWLAGTHLLELDCSRFFNITVKDTKSNLCDEFSRRSEGYSKALREAGMDNSGTDVFLDGSFQSSYRWILENSEMFNSGDGLFFHSDLMAFGALMALKERNIDVPDQVKIIGFDDSPISTLGTPLLTTVHQPKEALTEKACLRINEILKNRGEEKNRSVQVFLEPELIIRETT